MDSTCEFVKLPAWDRIYRKPDETQPLWLSLAKEEAVSLRSKMLYGVVDGFAPDAVIVDHLPHGLRGELLDALRSTNARKYLMLRGLLDSCDSAVRDLLAADSTTDLYDRVLVASDPRVTPIGNALPLSPSVTARAIWTGYVAHSPKSRNLVRSANGVNREQQWVVCSAGSGIRSRRLVEAFFHSCRRFPMVRFDIVLGSRSAAPSLKEMSLTPNARVSTIRPDLPDLHAACDVVMCSGGYNSVVEAMAGSAQLVVSPVNTGHQDEQYIHAHRLRSHYPILIADTPSDLPELLAIALKRAHNGPTVHDIDLNGASAIRKLLQLDLAPRQHSTS